jgi:hypothetical protein
MGTKTSGQRTLLGAVSVAASAALAGMALGATSSDTARHAATPARTFDPALLCRAQTTAALQARAAQRVQSGREP